MHTSDPINAGCYHNINGPLLLSRKEVGERTGIKPVRYDFSEPQAGKDICDRKAASMKGGLTKSTVSSEPRI